MRFLRQQAGDYPFTRDTGTLLPITLCCQNFIMVFTPILHHFAGIRKRSGSVCLNSFGRFVKWISASIMPPPSLVPAR